MMRSELEFELHVIENLPVLFTRLFGVFHFAKNRLR
ncbi:hypothetical protein KOR42_20250 [Thalassoglobus neptunius]|uniref:Uncharacterized protein n=1 Tax=Thalassoglobus neptunius TaxID=1938619 RepID=A0A5C5X8M6_9PLAN|nr:hypothetical protein KOR42_20250 [Thalassoglobus neptunius]